MFLLPEAVAEVLVLPDKTQMTVMVEQVNNIVQNSEQHTALIVVTSQVAVAAVTLVLVMMVKVEPAAAVMVYQMKLLQVETEQMEPEAVAAQDPLGISAGRSCLAVSTAEDGLAELRLRAGLVHALPQLGDQLQESSVGLGAIRDLLRRTLS